MGNGDETAETAVYEFDFFISRDGADRGWAEWIAWQIEEFEPEPGMRYRVLLQDWDFVPGSDWVERMEHGIRRARQVMPVLSPTYIDGEGYGAAEWRAFWRSDPHGRGRRVVPVRVRPCRPDGLLGSIVDIDLVGLTEPEAAERLRNGIRAASSGRRKPPVRPGWPDSDRAVPQRPPFPGRWIPPAVIGGLAGAGAGAVFGSHREPTGPAGQHPTPPAHHHHDVASQAGIGHSQHGPGQHGTGHLGPGQHGTGDPGAGWHGHPGAGHHPQPGTAQPGTGDASHTKDVILHRCV